MILIAPFAKKLRWGEHPNPKNYPHWKELIRLLREKNHSDIQQVGIEGEEQLVHLFHKNLTIDQLNLLIDDCSLWIGVDSFFQHLAWDRGKPGIVLWGPSDPLIFGHPENINLLKDRKYLRKEQFWWWEQCEYNEDAFVAPTDVLSVVESGIVASH